ncbi:MAG: DUF3034 family protein [Verrucomicrobiales bacterium]|nr:DUF3034 family protein [Verrucomicrobiales bacterium]
MRTITDRTVRPTSTSQRHLLSPLALMLATAAPAGLAAEEAASVQAEKGDPLPLHQIEGNGGIFATLSAYIVNPPREGEPLGRPSLGFAYVNLGHEQNLQALTLTESPWRRLELGYGWNRLGLGDLPWDLDNALAPAGYSGPSEVHLHNANARLQFIREGEFNQSWLPALTFGVHGKFNDGISEVNDGTSAAVPGGALATLAGIEDQNGVDFTLYASKLFPKLPRPVLVNLGGRATRGVWNGLGGFGEDYEFLFEGNIVVFLTGQLALAAEYKQQYNGYEPIGSLFNTAGDWWTIDAAYVVNKHVTLAAGYGHFGNVLNHEANGVWGVTTKYEF